MKKDAEVSIYMQQRKKGLSQPVAAARAGMSERTARKYERSGVLPSQSPLKKPRTYRTRPNPFEAHWDWLVAQLEADPALQATTLLGLLCEHYPDQYHSGQLRSLQRHLQTWRALYGPEREIIFEQIHTPGERAQSDFTHMQDLNITLAGQPFEHLLYHFVLTYSNVEAVRVCPGTGESFEALAEGLEKALWQIGGVPKQHRTDHLSAALQRLDLRGREDFTQRYKALMNHYGLEPTYNNVGIAHENGDVEQAHFRFKQAVDQALRVRGSRDWPSRAAYEQWLQALVHKRNLTRQANFAVEQQALRPLPAQPLAPCRELLVRVTRFSTVAILGNTYSVPSRLIGTQLLVRVRAEQIEGYVGTTLTVELPRLSGKHQVCINYRHLIWSLVRKPGAFAAYRHREELFPALIFRQAYDRLHQDQPVLADREYVRILHLAASVSQSEVETALALLAESERVPTFERVRELVQLPQPRLALVAQMKGPPLSLAAYDALLPSKAATFGSARLPEGPGSESVLAYV